MENREVTARRGASYEIFPGDTVDDESPGHAEMQTEGGAALTDVVAGHVDMFFDTLATSVPLYRDQKVKLMGVADLQRAGVVPVRSVDGRTIGDGCLRRRPTSAPSPAPGW